MNPAIPAQAQVFGPTIGAAFFWLFLAIVVGVSVSVQVFKHRETQKTIRQAIERGQPLDPETVSRLLEADRPPPPNRIGLALGGLVLVCIGVGIGLMGWFGSMDNPGMLHPALGVAALVCMIGLPLLIMSLFVRGRNGGGRG